MDKCPKCGLPEETKGVHGNDPNYCHLQGGILCLRNQLAQANARIAELESDSNTDLINLVEILATRLGDDTLHDKLLEKLTEGHSTPVKCAADVVWDKWMEAMNRIGEDVIKITELEEQIANYDTFGQGGANFADSQLLDKLSKAEGRVAELEARVGELVEVLKTTRKDFDNVNACLQLNGAHPFTITPAEIDKALESAQLTVDAHKLRIVEEFCEAVERKAEDKILITGKLEGAHYNAMKELREDYRERAKR